MFRAVLFYIAALYCKDQNPGTEGTKRGRYKISVEKEGTVEEDC